MTTLAPDLCIIGDSAGGLRAAMLAAAFGVPIILIRTGVQDEALAIGKQALLAAAETAARVRRASQFGIETDAVRVEFQRTMAHVRAVQSAIAPRSANARLRALGIRIVEGETPRFESTRLLRAGDHLVGARRFIIATGAQAECVPDQGGDGVFTPDTILGIERLPRRLAVVGGTADALEYAQAFRRLGADVTLLAPGDVLPDEDREQVAIVVTAFRREGIGLRTQTPLTSVSRSADGTFRLAFADGTADADALLDCTGRKAACDTLGLAAAGIGSGPGGIHADRQLRTDNPAISVIGAAAAIKGGGQGLHADRRQADLVMRQILFRLPVRYDPATLPRIALTEPGYAAIGLTEEAARARIGAVSVLRSAFAGNDKALADGERQGHAKLLLDRRGRLLGASLTGPAAAELIVPWAARLGRKPDAMRDSVPPGPSFAETPRQALMDAYAPLARSKTLRALSAFLRRFG